MIDSIELCELKINETHKLFREKKFNHLIQCYNSIINFKNTKTDDDYSNDISKYYSNLSYVYHLTRDFDNSLLNANKCIELNESWYKGYYRAAKACEGLLNKELALEFYHKMRQCDLKTATQYEQNEYHNIDISILREWLQNEGAIINNIKIEFYDIDYRGMCIDKTVKNNEVIIQIPMNCIISLEESKTRSYNKKLIDLEAKYNSPHTYLALELLDIKYTEGHKFQYITNCLPKYFDNVPIHFNEDKLKYLEGSFALVKIAQKKFYLEEEYNHIKNLLPEFPYSYEDFVWARTAIITRVYAAERTLHGVPVKDTVMVPFADMANHRIPPNTHWYYDKKKDSFIVHATKYLTNGENIFESYGQKCNYRYFVNYGFTIDKNPFEEVVIITNPMISSIISTKIYINNNNILRVINNCSETFQIGYDTKSEAMKNFIECTKYKCDEIYKKENKNKTATFEEVYTFIVLLLNKSLNEFKTSTEEDENILKNQDLSFDIRNCIVQRLSEKRLLKYLIKYFSDLVKLEQIKDEKDKKKFMKKMDHKHRPPYV